LLLEKHRHHIQEGILKTFLKPIRNFQSRNLILRVKSRAGIAGSECAETFAKYEACNKNNLPAQTTIRTACSGGNPFKEVN